MAKTPTSSNNAKKTGLRNNKIENKMYQMTCLNCEWKGDQSQSRSTVKTGGEQHKLSSRDNNTRKMHRLELVNVSSNK